MQYQYKTQSPFRRLSMLINSTRNITIMGVLALFLGCSDSKTQQQEKAALSIEVQKINPKTIALNFEYPARLKSIQSVNVYARVQGTLLSKNFNEGDIVQEGQLLFKIDPSRYQTKVNQAKAQYHSAEANFVKANRDWKRVEKLYGQGVYTIDQYDTSRANYLSAQANLANTKAALEDAKIDLGYTDVIATISGRAGMRRYDVGNLVGNSGQDVLTTITQLSPIYAEFSIPNSDYYFMRGLENNQIAVEYVLGNGKVYEKVGRLDFVDSVLDTQTSTIKARSIVDNDAHRLLPNEFIRVRLKGFEAQNAISIPQSALMQDSQGSYVYVIKDSKVQIARVNIGQNLKDNNVLILSGLESGDFVALNQLSKVRVGDSVNATERSNTPNDTSKAQAHKSTTQSQMTQTYNLQDRIQAQETQSDSQTHSNIG